MSFLDIVVFPFELIIMLIERITFLFTIGIFNLKKCEQALNKIFI